MYHCIEPKCKCLKVGRITNIYIYIYIYFFFFFVLPCWLESYHLVASQLSSADSYWAPVSNWTLLLRCTVSPEVYLMWGLSKEISFRRVKNVKQMLDGLVSFPQMFWSLMLVLCPGTQSVECKNPFTKQRHIKGVYILVSNPFHLGYCGLFQRMRWVDTITDSVDVNLGQRWEMVRNKEACSPRGCKESDTTWQLNNNNRILIFKTKCLDCIF